MKRILPLFRRNENRLSTDFILSSATKNNATAQIRNGQKSVLLASQSSCASQRFYHHLSPSSRHTQQRTAALPSKSAFHVRHSTFHTEADFHDEADESLETIQDILEEYLEDNDIETSTETEINLAAGVLTMKLPPHGTWVLNKQTPNRQIWWSSPLSGPRRYEWDEDVRRWTHTKADKNGSVEYLGDTLEEEMNGIFGIELSLKEV